MIFPLMLKYNNGFYHLLQSSLHILCLLLLKNFRFVTGFLKFIFCSLLFQIATVYCGVFLVDRKEIISKASLFSVPRFFCPFTRIFSLQVSAFSKYRVFTGVFSQLAAAERALWPLFSDFLSEKSRKQL